MLISHSKKFIFIHVYKVAGTSIGRTFGRYCDFSPSYRNPIKKIQLWLGQRPDVFSSDFPGHIKSLDLKSSLSPDIFNTYFKFAFVRNPWDWQVSLFEYARQTTRHQEFELTNKFKSFEDYLNWRIDDNYSLQSDFVLGESDNVLVDYIGKIENLEYDVRRISGELGIPFTPVPHINKSKRKDFRSYYNDQSAALIETTFKKDIELFGYTFD